jgi:FkbM family methyltransferase
MTTWSNDLRGIITSSGLQRFVAYFEGFCVSDSPVSLQDSIVAQAQLLQTAGRTAHHIIDGGAFEGEITAQYVAAFPDAHVWAFEPTPAQVERLRTRFAYEPRVTIVPAALGAVEGRAELALNDAPATNSLLSLDLATGAYLDHPVLTEGAVDVAVETLDGFCQKQGLESLSIVKLDVQGWEDQVIAGARQILRRGHVDLFFTEVNFVYVYEEQTKIWDLMRSLNEHGYQLYDLYGARRSSAGQLKWCDALFTSPAFRAAGHL